ncbi:MAG: hypothetical protein HYZ29_14070 [Myxococcales bacterium]|nr:hypothetical protein [Myxococcales bacterium]
MSSLAPVTHPLAFLRACLVASLALACSVEPLGEAPGDAGPAGAGGSTLGGFGGDGASAGAGGTGGSQPVACGAGQECVPKAGPQWSYAFLVVDPFSTAPGPTCPDGATPQMFGTEPAGAGTCAPCQCGPLQGGSCTVPLLCAENGTCAGPQGYTKTNGDCVGKTGSPTLSCQLGPPTVVTPGSCAPTGGAVAPLEPFQKRASLCLLKAGSPCGDGSECVPVGTGAYAPNICIYLPGEQACPSDYPTATIIHQKHVDQRKCSPCVCTPGAATCSAEYAFYDDMLCAGGGQKVSSAACTEVSGKINDFWAGWSYQRTLAPVLGGSCVPSGGTPGGQIVGDPNGALTVCCRAAQLG